MTQPESDYTPHYMPQRWHSVPRGMVGPASNTIIGIRVERCAYWDSEGEYDDYGDPHSFCINTNIDAQRCRSSKMRPFDAIGFPANEGPSFADTEPVDYFTSQGE